MNLICKLFGHTPPEMEPDETGITIEDGQWCFHSPNMKGEA